MHVLSATSAFGCKVAACRVLTQSTQRASPCQIDKLKQCIWSATHWCLFDDAPDRSLPNDGALQAEP
jgi:hypothetical protein